ncbi:hypothetical protein LHJ74_07020 [Streptomyces sp. N2-109]|uniref:Lipoprotein n=1 Tax=Streptomyces gossypii TaxID=2883101 RepID=A0ABT2JQY3_9ACTN|nr:hypothetical protein [Streptomyces gossypii]MCT2589674.1 hypothetical protein [Streptomyces gossypii]
MRRPTRRGGAAVGTALVLAALSACSDDGDGTDDAGKSPSPSATSTASPSGSAPSSPSASPSPSEETLKVKDLDQKCAEMGKGVPEAAEYKGKGPHTMAVFQDDYEGDSDLSGSYTFWQVRFPDVEVVMGPEEAAEMELLACGEGSKGSQQVGSCNYTRLGTDATTYPLYSQTYTYTVYELRTGKAVRRVEAAGAGSPDGCPDRLSGSVAGSKKPSRVYAQMTRDQTEDLLRQFVTGPAR